MAANWFLAQQVVKCQPLALFIFSF